MMRHHRLIALILSMLLIAGCGSGPFAERQPFADIDTRVGRGDPRFDTGFNQYPNDYFRQQESIGTRGEFVDFFTLYLGEPPFQEPPLTPEQLRVTLSPPGLLVDEPDVIDGDRVASRYRYHFIDQYGRPASAGIVHLRDEQGVRTEARIDYAPGVYAVPRSDE
ncbi:MAG: hypothetical protein WD294_07570 [Phycisphaeraceae bacterium]